MKESIVPLLERYRNGMVPVSESKEIKKCPAAKLDKSIKIGGYKDQKPTGDKDLVEVINNKNEKREDKNLKQEKKEDKPKSPISISPKPSVSPRPSQSPNISKPTTPQNEVKVKESISQSDGKERENKQYTKDSFSKSKTETSNDYSNLQKKKSTHRPIKNNPQPDAKFRKYKLFK